MVEVRRSVHEGKSPDDTSGLRIGVRGAIALEVLVDDEAVGSGTDVPGLFIEDVVGVETDLLCGSGVIGGEVVLEPLEHRTGRDLAALDGVLAGHDAVGVRAEESLAVDLSVRLAGQHVRGAGDESHRTWGQHAQSNLAGPCISQTLRTRSGILSKTSPQPMVS